jgi:hypothetical protein
MTPRRFLVIALSSFVVGAAAVALVGSVFADDANIGKDFKEAKSKGKEHMAERAAFWEAKGVSGKDAFWLARFYDELGEDDKAVVRYQEYLKVPDASPKNKETAAWKIVFVSINRKDWPKVPPAMQGFRKDFPDASPAVLAQSHDEEGRAWWLQGDEAKALESFTKAADMKSMSGIFDLADVHMVMGRYDQVKAVVEKYFTEDLKGGKANTLEHLKEWATVLGTDAPALDKAVSVGTAEAPTDWKGKTTVTYYWFKNLTTADAGWRALVGMASRVGGNAGALAVSGFDKFNPVTRKVEEGIAAEEEIRLTKLMVEQAKWGAPPAIIVPEELRAALHLNAPGQKTIIGPDGKFRYVRLPDGMAYDWMATELALKKIAASAP